MVRGTGTFIQSLIDAYIMDASPNFNDKTIDKSHSLIILLTHTRRRHTTSMNMIYY